MLKTQLYPMRTYSTSSRTIPSMRYTLSFLPLVLHGQPFGNLSRTRASYGSCTRFSSTFQYAESVSYTNPPWTYLIGFLPTQIKRVRCVYRHFMLLARLVQKCRDSEFSSAVLQLPSELYNVRDGFSTLHLIQKG